VGSIHTSTADCTWLDRRGRFGSLASCYDIASHIHQPPLSPRTDGLTPLPPPTTRDVILGFHPSETLVAHPPRNRLAAKSDITRSSSRTATHDSALTSTSITTPALFQDPDRRRMVIHGHAPRPGKRESSLNSKGVTRPSRRGIRMRCSLRSSTCRPSHRPPPQPEDGRGRCVGNRNKLI